MIPVAANYLDFGYKEIDNIEFVETLNTNLSSISLDAMFDLKLADDTYHMEIVSQGVQEYKIWKKLN